MFVLDGELPSFFIHNNWSNNICLYLEILLELMGCFHSCKKSIFDAGFLIHVKVINFAGMEEQFILRVPPSVAERIDRLLSENASSSDDKSLDLSFTGNALFSCSKESGNCLLRFFVQPLLDEDE